MAYIARGTEADATSIDDGWKYQPYMPPCDGANSIAAGQWRIVPASSGQTTASGCPGVNGVDPKAGWNVTGEGKVKVSDGATAGRYVAYYMVEQDNNRMPFNYHVKTFEFEVIVLTISANSVEISKKTNGTQTPATVMVGQQVQLSASISPSLTISSMSWTVPGDRIKTFAITPWTPANPNANPPVVEIKPKGEKVDLTSSDLQANQSISPSFYFTSGSLSGTDVEVTCSVVVNGKTVSNKGKIKVYSPQMNSFTSTWSSLNPVWGIRSFVNDDDIPDGTYLMMGNFISNPGITWNVQVQTPNISGLTLDGEIGFLQLITLDRSINYSDIGVKTVKSTSGVLDTDHKYLNPAESDPQIYNQTYIGVNVTSNWGSDDSPANGLAGTLGTSFDDQFKLYLMYRPNSTGGIWVTLGTLNWGASASSTFNTTTNQHVLNAGSTPSSGGTGPTGSESSELPSWSDGREALSRRSELKF